MSQPSIYYIQCAYGIPDYSRRKVRFHSEDYSTWTRPEQAKKDGTMLFTTSREAAENWVAVRTAFEARVDEVAAQLKILNAKYPSMNTFAFMEDAPIGMMGHPFFSRGKDMDLEYLRSLTEKPLFEEEYRALDIKVTELNALEKLSPRHERPVYTIKGLTPEEGIPDDLDLSQPLYVSYYEIKGGQLDFFVSHIEKATTEHCTRLDKFHQTDTSDKQFKEAERGMSQDLKTLASHLNVQIEDDAVRAAVQLAINALPEIAAKRERKPLLYELRGSCYMKVLEPLSAIAASV